MRATFLQHLHSLNLVLIALLAASLPFELRTPLLQLGPLSITNTEAVLYLVLIAWAARVLLVRRIAFTAVQGAVVLMGLALVLSALFAPTERAAAWKFTLRSLGGMALSFAVADVVRTPRQRQLVVGALVVVALLSALAGLAEVWQPASWPWLAAFKPRLFNVGGFIRAGGTFDYPNTAAMFWEAVLPLGVTLAAIMGRGAAFGNVTGLMKLRSRMLRPYVTALCVAILTQAIILSASRAALVGVALALVVLMGLAWWKGRSKTSQVSEPARLTVSLVGGAVALLVVAVNLIANPLMALRLRTETNDAWFRAEIAADRSPITLPASETMTATVRLRNTSIVAWQAMGAQPVRLSYHWLDAATNQTVVLNGLRTDLPNDLPPDAEIALAARVQAPAKPGEYILQWDVLQEHVAWFSTYQNPTLNVPVTVMPSAKPVTAAPPTEPMTRTVRTEPTRRELWRAAFQLWRQHPLFGIGPDNFRHVYGPSLGLTQFNTAIHTNNWYIEVLTNTGLVGAAAFVVFMLALARAALKSVGASWLIVGCWVAILTFFAHGLLDYFFEFTPTYGLFWLLVGLVSSAQTSDEQALKGF